MSPLLPDFLARLDPVYLYGGGFLIMLILGGVWNLRTRPPARPKGPGYAEAEAAWQALARGLGLDLAAARPARDGRRAAQVGGWRVAGALQDGRPMRLWSTWALYARFSAMAQREQQDLERSGGVQVACKGPDGPVPAPPGFAVSLHCAGGWLTWTDDVPPGTAHPVWGTGPERVALQPEQVIRFVEGVAARAQQHEQRG